MNNYGYLQGLLFFMISGSNVKSNFIKLSMDGFLTQWLSRESNNTQNGVRTKELWPSEVGGHTYSNPDGLTITSQADLTSVSSV